LITPGKRVSGHLDRRAENVAAVFRALSTSSSKTNASGLTTQDAEPGAKSEWTCQPYSQIQKRACVWKTRKKDMRRKGSRQSVVLMRAQCKLPLLSNHEDLDWL